MRKCIFLLAFSVGANAGTVIFRTPCHKEREPITVIKSVIHTVPGNNEKDADHAIIVGFWYNNGAL